MSRNKKLLFSEAFILSAVIRLIILTVPFKKVRQHMGVYNAESPFQADNEKEYKTVRDVRWAVTEASQYTPWKSKCLIQAITAQHMLKKRSIYSTIYLGVKKDENNKLIAHAWLRYGKLIVTGGNAMNGFTEVAKFTNYKSDNL